MEISLPPLFHSPQSSQEVLIILLVSVSESRSVVSNCLQPHGLYSPWNSPGQNTGVGSLSLLQGIFSTRIEPRSPALQADSLPAEPQEKTYYIIILIILFFIFGGSGSSLLQGLFSSCMKWGYSSLQGVDFSLQWFPWLQNLGSRA